MSTPYWLQDAIFYQIFPDRFSNGDPSNDLTRVDKWGSAPNIWNFQGGDLRGIIQRFDYLLDLGINAIYLNPIFHAPTIATTQLIITRSTPGWGPCSTSTP